MAADTCRNCGVELFPGLEVRIGLCSLCNASPEHAKDNPLWLELYDKKGEGFCNGKT